MALPHLVGNDENGYLYPPGDVEGLSNLLARLVAEPDLRRRLGAASLLRVKAHDMSATLTAFEQCYDAILATRPVEAVRSSVDRSLVTTG